MSTNADDVGIVSFGGYVPCYRIKAETIAEAHHQDSDQIQQSLQIFEKSVPGKDEDTITIAVQAAQHALERCNFDKTNIGAIYVGSESHPYAVKPSAAIVGEVLGVGNNYTAADTEFACKAGTAALQIVLGLVKADMISYGLAIGADTSQSAQGDALEYSAAAGGAAFIVGKEQIAAKLITTLSYTSDTPDFWRRQIASVPQHTGRFTSEPAYFKHIITCTERILAKTGFTPQDFHHVIFHQPNGKFPLQAAKHFGFTEAQLHLGLLAPYVGNTYSGASLLGLCNVLEHCFPGQRILLTSYGSGSGSDSFIFETTPLLVQAQEKAIKMSTYLERKKYVTYSTYRKTMEMIH